MRIALVHDYLIQFGGAERVLKCFTEIFPDAHIYTLIYDEELTHGFFKNKNIHTSFLQKFPFSRRKHQAFPLLMLLAIEQFDFSAYDVVLSDSASYAKGIITGSDTLHISYIHTPTRYIWDDCQKYVRDSRFPFWIKKLIPLALNYLRLWDRSAAERPDMIIANSRFVARRIKKYYDRDSVVVHPPVDTKKFYIEPKSSARGNYFLMVGRLIPYKRYDIVIEAFNRLGWPLKIIGRGTEMKNLRQRAKANIEFLGRVKDEDLPRYYAQCRAFIFPQEEDFGIVAIEAMASGRPVIAYRGGDIPEHLEEGKTGMFFNEQTSEALEMVLRKFREEDYDPDYIRACSLKFDKEIFKRKIKEIVERKLAEFKKEKEFRK